MSHEKSIYQELLHMTNLFSKRYLIDKPVLVVEHRCFFNTEIYDMPETFRPNWFGTVRDPIDRYVSWYYYRATRPRALNKPPWLLLVWIYTLEIIYNLCQIMFYFLSELFKFWWMLKSKTSGLLLQRWRSRSFSVHLFLWNIIRVPFLQSQTCITSMMNFAK